MNFLFFKKIFFVSFIILITLNLFEFITLNKYIVASLYFAFSIFLLINDKSKKSEKK